MIDDKRKRRDAELLYILAHGNDYQERQVRIPYSLMGMSYLAEREDDGEDFYIWDTQEFDKTLYTALMRLVPDKTGKLESVGINFFEIARDEDGFYRSLIKVTGEREKKVYKQFCDFYGYAYNPRDRQ